FAQDMLTGLERGFAHGVVHCIGSEDMDRLDGFVGKQRMIVAGGAGDADAVSERAGLLLAGSGYRGDFHISEPADVFRVDSTHEPCPDDGGGDLTRHFFFTLPGSYPPGLAFLLKSNS